MEALTFGRVQRASQAAAALFRWCAWVLACAANDEAPVVVDEPPLTTLEVDALQPEAITPEEIVEQEVPKPEEHNALAIQVEEEESPEPPELRGFKERRLLRLWHNISKASGPDRHFEESLSFCVGRYAIEREQLPVLMDMMSCMCVRPRLRLQLSGCADMLEGSHVSVWRLNAVKRFFVKRGVPVFSAGEGRPASIENPSCILCKVHLNDERQVRDYFKARDDAWRDSTLGPSDLDFYPILLAAISSAFFETDEAQIDMLANTSRNHRRAFQALASFAPLLTISDILLANGLETNLRTHMYHN